MTLVNFDGLLPSATIMVVSITASTTSGKQLPDQVLQNTIEACDYSLALDLSREKVLDFLETRMGDIAPNLSAIVGRTVAAKLTVTAGGLLALANMPSCSVRLLGAKKTNWAGFSSQFCVGYIEETKIFRATPPSLRKRACRLLADKATMGARIDSVSEHPAGNKGRALRDEIRKTIEKLQQLPPAKCPKPLQVFDCKPKKKRSGRRLRRMSKGMR